MLQNFPPDLRRLTPRITRTGDPSASLAGVNTTILPDGSLCFVIENRSDYVLDKTSNAAPDGDTVIEPESGPGRWLIRPIGSSTLQSASIFGGSLSIPNVAATFVTGFNSTTPPLGFDDSNGAFPDLANDRLNLPVGTYHAGGSGSWEAGVGNTRTAELVLGVAQVGRTDRPPTTVGGSQQVFAAFRVTAATTLRLRVAQDSGGALTFSSAQLWAVQTRAG